MIVIDGNKYYFGEEAKRKIVKESIEQRLKIKDKSSLICGLFIAVMGVAFALIVLCKEAMNNLYAFAGIGILIGGIAIAVLYDHKLNKLTDAAIKKSFKIEDYLD